MHVITRAGEVLDGGGSSAQEDAGARRSAAAGDPVAPGVGGTSSSGHQAADASAVGASAVGSIFAEAAKGGAEGSATDAASSGAGPATGVAPDRKGAGAGAGAGGESGREAGEGASTAAGLLHDQVKLLEQQKRDSDRIITLLKEQLAATGGAGPAAGGSAAVNTTVEGKAAVEGAASGKEQVEGATAAASGGVQQAAETRGLSSGAVGSGGVVLGGVVAAADKAADRRTAIAEVAGAAEDESSNASTSNSTATTVGGAATSTNPGVSVAPVVRRLGRALAEAAAAANVHVRSSAAEAARWAQCNRLWTGGCVTGISGERKQEGQGEGEEDVPDKRWQDHAAGAVEDSLAGALTEAATVGTAISGPAQGRHLTDAEGSDVAIVHAAHLRGGDSSSSGGEGSSLRGAITQVRVGSREEGGRLAAAGVAKLAHADAVADAATATSIVAATGAGAAAGATEGTLSAGSGAGSGGGAAAAAAPADGFVVRHPCMHEGEQRHVRPVRVHIHQTAAALLRWQPGD